MRSSDAQFRSTHLFYALTLTAASVALLGAWGMGVSLFVLLIWWQILSSARREARAALARPLLARRRTGGVRLETAVAGVVVLLVLGLFMPAPERVDSMEQARISMQLVARAVAAYQAEHGCLPGSTGDGDTGLPSHSWRVAILDAIGEAPLARSYDPDQSWDAKDNQAIARYRPWHYHPFYPCADAVAATHTSLHLIANERGFWIVEHAGLAEHWMHPGRLDAEAFQRANTMPPQGEGFWQEGFFVSTFRGRLAVNAHQSTTLLPGDPLPPPDRFASSPRSARGVHIIHYGNIVRLVIFLAVALYPIRWLNRINASMA
ncbi:MAG: DUF1559 domain-containing protein [Planctomycetota bacterium]|nr:MAG: DUF1559 domain-containing protein [Planctomycetota bacterium]